MGLASSLKKVSNKTLMKFGGDITIKRTTFSSYDVEAGSVVKNQTSSTVKGFLEGVTSREVNDLISQDDKKVIVSAGAITFTPTTKDKVIISSIEYKIIQIDKEEQNNIDILYVIYLRA